MAPWPTGSHIRITGEILRLKLTAWKAKQAEKRNQDPSGIAKPYPYLPDASTVLLGFYVS